MLRRLRPLEYYRVRVRALGPHRTWVSAWSVEVSLKTLSMAAARAANHEMTAERFFVPSERRIASVVMGSDTVAGDAALDVLPTAEELSELRARDICDRLNSALGPLDRDAVKDLLDARLCAGGQKEFVKAGARYSQPSAEREQRMRRMRLAIAAQELYKPAYADGNPWCMGPFYYEEAGMQTMDALQRGGA